MVTEKQRLRKRTGFVLFMRAMTFVYALGAIAFFFGQEILGQLLLMPVSTERFWVALAVSMMAMLSFISWKSSRRPGNPAWVQVHLLSKAVSVAGFLIAFVFYESLPAYFFSGALDAAILAAVYFLHRKDYGSAL